MRKLLFIVVAAVLTMFASCDWFKSKKVADSDTTIVAAPAEVDSTLYGKVVDDFGMSTFAVQQTSGQELELLRSHQDGGEATIYGDVRVGDEFALLTTDGGDALDCAINVTEVKALTNDFKIVNGKLLLNVDTTPDTVQIMTLDADSLVAKGATQVYRLGKAKK